ncbi:MAG: MFS transporter [Methanomicrobiaceae archaeon]|nr:MFS transporter [Methanomicrobiaceae archaeon]
MKELRPILGLSAAHLITDLYSPVLPAILPLLILEDGLPFFAAGLIVTAYQLTSSFLQPLVGWAFDRRGTTVHISYSVFLSAFFISLIGFVQDYLLILICAMLAALGHAFFHPSALGTVSRLARDGVRGRLTSYFVVGGNLGFAIGPILAGIVVGMYGLQGLGLLLIPGLLTAGVLQFALPRPAHISEAVSERGAPPMTHQQKYGISLLITGSAFRSWAIFSSIAFLPTFIAQRGADIIWANTLVSGMLFAGVAGQVVGGILSDRYGRKELTLTGLVLSIPPFALFLATTGWVSILCLILFGFLLWSTFSVTVAMAHEMVPGNVGLISGLVLGFAVGSGGAGVAVIGYLADLYSLGTALLLLVVPIMLALIFFGLVPYPWKGRKGP